MLRPFLTYPYFDVLRRKISPGSSQQAIVAEIEAEQKLVVAKLKEKGDMKEKGDRFIFPLFSVFPALEIPPVFRFSLRYRPQDPFAAEFTLERSEGLRTD
ncbi:MAG: hypothetical protein WCH07_12650 [Deltaproteobacteria bacterium]